MEEFFHDLQLTVFVPLVLVNFFDSDNLMVFISGLENHTE